MANGSIATKTADYTLVSMAPDVCWTKVGKSWRPIPYNITHTMDNSENVSPNVFAGGKEAFMHGESFITGVTGDEPGRRGGIVTGTLTEISFGLEKSGSVYVNGKPSVRTGDQVWMNQTTPAAKQGKVGPDKPTSWVKVVATYDDPWKTPIHEAPLILSINGQCVAPMSTLSGGTGHNTTVSSQAMAIQTQEEPGTLVQVGVDPGSVEVVGDTIPGLEDVNRELRFSLESSLDTTYRRVLTSMQEFQSQWDEYGIFSTAISYKDGALAGSELWFDHLADTKKLITETDWQGLSETAYEKVTAGLETAVGSIEDSHKKAANWLIEGAQQEKPWAWFGNQITDASEYAWNAYTNTVEDVADDIADLFKETKEDLESIADISVKLFEHRDDIFLFFQNISSANTSDIANFIDTVIADIDPELARSIKEDTDSYGVFLELINDDAGRIFLSYLGLIIGAVPPNFYAFLYGAAAAYIILEVLFCILLAFISGGLAVAARFAAIIARIAVMGMKVTAVNKRIASGARAVSAYIDSLKVIESSLKQLKAIGANTRRIKLKDQKASGSTGETLVIERKVVPNEFGVIYAKAPAAKIEIDGVADDIAEMFGGQVAKAPIKSQERAIQKIMNDYDGDATKIKDLARNTIIVPPDKLDSAVAELAKRGASIKVIDGAKDPLGYSGVNSTIKTQAGIVGEIQVNTPAMIYAKESEAMARALVGDDLYTSVASKSGIPGGQGHKFYEEWRVLSPSSTQAQSIAEQSRAYYEAIRRSNGY
jgi:hypothetical protein